MSSVLSEYLKSIGRYPLLNKNQEIILGRRVQAWLNDPDPSPSVVRSGKRAQDKMIKCNLRLVVSVAKRYSNRLRRTELIDIIQEGTIGLTRGVQKFDPERGYALSTYVYWWIRQAITRYIQTNDRLIKLPNGGSDAVVKLREWCCCLWRRTTDRHLLRSALRSASSALHGCRTFSLTPTTAAHWTTLSRLEMGACLTWWPIQTTRTCWIVLRLILVRSFYPTCSTPSRNLRSL